MSSTILLHYLRIAHLICFAAIYILDTTVLSSCWIKLVLLYKMYLLTRFGARLSGTIDSNLYSSRIRCYLWWCCRNCYCDTETFT